MRVLITGGSGFVGQRLCRQLVEQGHEVQVVSRSPHQVRDRLPNNCDIRDSAQAFIESPPDALVNLAGEPIAAKRWSDEQKAKLINSRVAATEQLVALCEQLKANGQPLPKVMVSGSAMGYYGDQGKRVVTEKTMPNDEFAHRLCKQWEAAAKPIEAMGVRLAIVRIGLVLEAGGGSLERMLPPFKWGLGGRFGSGEQFMPWIHRDDLVAAILFLINQEDLSGAFNGCAPHPVTNATFTKTLASHLNRPAIFPVPAFVLKAGFGEMSRLLLTGADMRPVRLEEAGFSFQYPTLDKALEAIL
ncbi:MULTISPECIES: TIGR01777 family oxidoreductase [Halomonadaceae]|uniref:TIGR01777 family oxidoreductase n=1 Tax=Halomonadaceae TaxID=28256 RepID=UPI0004833E02|nr:MULTISPECIES: TIGR01777 family oxidoreductase [Halomonas]NAO97830.1 TIGR01777 family protein [Halomonas sp. MG34]QGQ69060.1 TIGR01777 family protein [Halomonas sp. PA16-9]UEQ04430.1 TIGR01777 family oxidoreductase [Halomonas profundus]PKH62598.1 TIGR01777 family protein [Halomonas sp. Choline-3u-9]CAD5247006.1 Epimerase family protein YfcH [Halomonas sp. I3]